MTPASATSPNSFGGHGTNRPFYLPRLSREHYQGDAAVHWTLPVARRESGWLDDLFHARFREIMMHTATREGLFCPVYCLMPDHIHLLWLGLRLDTDQRQGMKFLREHVGPFLRPRLFQHQAHDHVLRDEERQHDAFARVCFYILANPVRAGYVAVPQCGMSPLHSMAWPYCGAIIPGYPTLHPLDDDFWPLFWKLYQAARAPDAGNLNRSWAPANP